MAYSTQQSIPIAGIKDGIVILKNGGYRMVLEVSAVNFALKSEQEQNSIVFQYQSFLNSLHFPIEITIRSKRLDLNPYLAKIKKSSETSINDLIKVQINDYVDFVSQLISVANIMKKSFYVVVPYDPITVAKLNVFQGLFAKTQTFDHLKIADSEFKASVDQLKARGDTVASGLGSMGLHCVQLSTKELIELFYQVYNPDEAGKERLEDINQISSQIVESKAEMNSSIQTDTNIDETGAAIDNSAIVQAQQKQAAEQRRQESMKEGERQMGMTPQGNKSAGAPAGQSIQTNPAPINQPITPTQPVTTPNQSTQPTNPTSQPTPTTQQTPPAVNQ